MTENELISLLEQWEHEINILSRSTEPLGANEENNNSRAYTEMLQLLAFLSDNGKKEGLEDIINNTCYVVSRTGLTKNFHNQCKKRIKQLENLYANK